MALSASEFDAAPEMVFASLVAGKARAYPGTWPLR